MPERHDKTEKARGMELRELNDKIVNCLLLLKQQRDELAYIIEKQYEERKKLETEMERITYKLCLINKSLAQRVQAKENYDKTIAEIEEKYKRLVENSGELLIIVEKELDQLDSLNNKKTGTEDTPKSIFDNIIIDNPVSLEGNKACNLKPTKDGKGDRETKPANSSQTNDIDLEMPIKLEKGEAKMPAPDPNIFEDIKAESASIELSSIKENSADGDADNSGDTEDTDSITRGRGRLSAVAQEYKEVSLRESLSSNESVLHK